MAEYVIAALGILMVGWAFHRVFVWPFTRKRKATIMQRCPDCERMFQKTPR